MIKNYDLIRRAKTTISTVADSKYVFPGVQFKSSLTHQPTMVTLFFIVEELYLSH